MRGHHHRRHHTDTIVTTTRGRGRFEFLQAPVGNPLVDKEIDGTRLVQPRGIERVIEGARPPPRRPIVIGIDRGYHGACFGKGRAVRSREDLSGLRL
jgi:hypothetical protein